MMSSRCLRSRCFLACAESSAGLCDEDGGDDSDKELLPLSGILVIQDKKKFYLFLHLHASIIFWGGGGWIGTSLFHFGDVRHLDLNNLLILYKKKDQIKCVNA